MKLLFLVLVFFPILLYGQVEHNFTMGPQKTTCDSLEVQGLDTAQLIEKVRNTTFRYHEQMKVSRYKIPQQVWFFSCDGKTGYLVARETEEDERVYKNVHINMWNELMNSTDPVSVYQRIRDSLE